jgi:hypothetical protein
MITQSYSTELKTDINSSIDYIAFVFDNRQVKTSDNISSYHEFCRIAPTKTINTNNILLECVIPITQDHLLTTVTNKINNKEYTLSSVTGLQIGDSIVFNYDNQNKIKDKVVNISGNNVTLEKGSSNITASMTVSQEITYIHIIKGGSTTANTGNSIFILPFNKIKFEYTQVDFTITIVT